MSVFYLKRCQFEVQYNSNYSDAGYPDARYQDRFSPLDNFVENSTKLICLEITGYRVDMS
jgi:hypothetical protein